MVEYHSSKNYVLSAKTLKEKIAKVDAIIEALEACALDSAAGENVTSYMLDNGQTKINEVYRSGKEIVASIETYNRLRQYYANKLLGSRLRLVDYSNFTRRRNGC